MTSSEIRIQHDTKEWTTKFDNITGILIDGEEVELKEAINCSNDVLISVMEAQSVQITKVCIHTAYIKKIGRLACILGGIAVILGCLALWVTLVK